MAQLAILGHATRGKEVIEILEMLGGKNEKEYNGENNCLQHHINERNEISVFTHVFDVNDFIFYTLEEFLGKFPYKVGDKVQNESATSCGSVYEVTNMEWNNNTVEYTVLPIGAPNVKTKCLVTDLRFLEEQNSISPYMDYDVKGNVMVGKGTLVEIDLTRELDKADVIEVVLGDYEFVLKDGKTYFVKKKPKYPKTYEELL